MEISKSFIRFYLIIWIFIAILSFGLQFFLAEIITNASVWEKSSGWQQHLALYNIGLLVAIIYALVLNNREIMRFLTVVLIVFSLIIGGFNLISMILVSSIAIYNIFMVFIHFFASLLGIYLYIVDSKSTIL
ncbi:MAG: hypothetical protein ACFFAH_08210 [Promethearchaeota archaeon]